MADFLGTMFGGAAEAEAADKNRQLLAQYGPQAQGYLKDAYTQGRTDLGSAIGAYTPLANIGAQYNKGGNAMLDALGVNGPGGYERAMQGFHTGPGFNFMRDQGLEAVDRRRAGMSMGQSGNADIDTMNYAEGLANQEFQNYIKNLGGAGQMGLQATGAAAQGQAGGYTNLANLGQTYAQNQTGVAGNVLSGNMDANKLQAAGEAAGAKNLLGAGMAVGSMALGIPPVGMGGGGGGGGGGGYSGSQGYQFQNSPLGSLFRSA